MLNIKLIIMKLKIIQNIEDFQLLEKDWNNLYSKGEYSRL